MTNNSYFIFFTIYYGYNRRPKERLIMIRKYILTVSLFFCFVSTHLFAVEIKALPPTLTLPKALYNHCLELTQSQQLLKEYILIGLQNRYKNPEKTLPVSIEKYDTRLKTLQHFLDTQFHEEKSRKQFAEGVALWEKIKLLLSSPPSKENAKQIQTMLAAMYKKLKATKVLANKKFESVKITGRICYSSQKMATLYLLKKAWQLTIPDYQTLMKKSMADFEKRMKKLASLKINTPEITKALKEANLAYSYFVHMYDAKSTVIPTLIVRKSDTIFEKIETVKRLYGALLRNK